MYKDDSQLSYQRYNRMNWYALCWP